MVENISEIKEQIQQLLNNLDQKAKLLIIASALITVVGLLILVNWASRPEYEVLFSDLSAQDAATIVESLDEKNISYQLEEEGTTILVPEERVHRLRLDLAGEDLPTGGVAGFELFDENQLGSTDFDQQVNYIRALSGELSRTIKQINNVNFARVQITPSETSIYRSEETPAKASVLLGVDSGQKLSQGNIKSIANLVASSVEDLSADNVTIVDDAGNLLSAQLEEESQFESSYEQFELQESLERRVERDLDVMLTKVLGMDNFVVRVNAELDFDQHEIESKSYEPVVDDSGIARSEQVKEERESGRTADPEGVPGTTSNLPEYEATNEEESERENIERITNYEINETIERYVRSPGAVERMSVSVIVNQEMDPQLEERVNQAVASAVGYDVDRGDQISVTGIEFDDSLEQMRQEELAAEESRRQRILLYLLVGVGILIATLLVILYRRREQPDETTATEEVESGEVGEEIDYLIDEAQDEFAAANLSEEEKERQRLQQNIRNLVQDQPEEIANLVRSWLGEE
ncbi:flagellar M-ring protein FliF [Natroniella sulfidigena]|uniref:flagellar basal-body MS-ring/collar protein FliF n=1 Tax=Natroniella sulfidigena TaxID=723921 RepID=UPI00200A7D1C|nr:flagellar basal-body MS-ring/collar protein FliF [Natroniella sulfidigena]MCK8816534.1 flagellar M-ring protein FliF [Natroniella sulfidigena]